MATNYICALLFSLNQKSWLWPTIGKEHFNVLALLHIDTLRHQN